MQPTVVVGNVNKLPLERGLYGQQLDGLDDHPSPGRVERPLSDRHSPSSAGSTMSRSSVPRVRRTGTPPSKGPLPTKDNVDPFTTMGSCSGKSKSAVSIPMAQRSVQEAHPSPQTPNKPRPRYPLPTSNTPIIPIFELHPLLTPLSPTPSGRRASDSIAQDGSSASTKSRVAGRAQIAVNTNTMALLTPPPSDRRKKPSSQSSAHRTVKEEDVDAGSAGYLPTPTKVSRNLA